MASDTHNDPKPDGAAFDDFFDSIGNKVENTNKQNGATNGAEVEGTVTEADDEPRVVDEIESLCMNCHANVSSSKCCWCAELMNTGNHTPATYTNTLLPRNHNHVLLLPSLQLQECRDSICR
jgi:hypothetical protein